MNARSTQKFTNHELALCAQREIGWRQRVYPRRVEEGTMRGSDAEREIAMMREIARVLESLDQPELFQ